MTNLTQDNIFLANEGVGREDFLSVKNYALIFGIFADAKVEMLEGQNQITFKNRKI